jgi:hypothetical protein
MNTDPLTTVRDDFRAALKAHAEEGWRMQELLLQVEPAADDGHRERIQAQQMILNAAKQRYEEARNRYVREILGTLAASGATMLP